MSESRKGFETPPEVQAYFRDKGLKPAFSWLDVWGQEHAYAFTIAKAVDAELLTTFKASIEKAIASGQGFETWRAGLIPELQRLGWYGKRRVDDPTGQWKSKEIDFSSPRRLETIFWSNVRSANAAGQWERIQRTKAGAPYILYVRTTSGEPRKEHLAWAGLILPVDDPFWRTHFPPNGWHCKCSVRHITAREADRLDKSGGYQRTAPDVVTKPFVNRRSGEVMHVPVGIDPGWGTNPGLSRARTLVENLTMRLDEAGPEAAKARIKEILQSPTPKILMGIDERLRLPVAVSTKLAEEMGARSPIIMASNDAIAIKTSKKGVDIALEHFLRAQEMIDAGELVDEGQKEKRTIFSRLWRGLVKIVVQKSAGGFLRIATIFPSDSKKRAAALERGMKKSEE